MEETSSVSALNSTEEDGESVDFHVYLFGCYIGIGAVGVIGNLFVVVVMLRSISLRKKLTNMFIVNQSVVDAVSSALLIGTYATDLARIYGSLDSMSDMTCRFWVNQATLWGGFTASTYNLLALNMERYLGVVHPIVHKRAFTQQKAFAIMAVVWVFGYAYGWAYAVPSSGVVDGECQILSLWPSDYWQRFFGVINLLVQFVLPLAILAFYYIQMIVVLRRKSRVAPMYPAAQSGAKSSPAQRKILKMLLLITMCFVVCWSWNEILVLLMCFGLSVELSGPFFEFTVIMVFVNCCCNPFIYALKHEEFRKSLKKMFRVKNRTSPHSTLQQVSTVNAASRHSPGVDRSSSLAHGHGDPVGNSAQLEPRGC